MSAARIRIALIGNPNTGKSTLFNALSGLRQQVGNYSGVTVDMKTGTFTDGETTFEIIDLPGTYSLAPRSPDEMVAVDLLLGKRAEEPAPDVILSIVDASNLDRHLYLTTQVMEIGKPMVLAVNMLDVAQGQGMTIDIPTLARRMGLPVVAIQANQGTGLEELKAALKQAARSGTRPTPPALPAQVDEEAAGLLHGLDVSVEPFLLRRLLLDINGTMEREWVLKHGEAFRQRLTEARERLKANGNSVPGVEAKARYAYIRGITTVAVTKPLQRSRTLTDRLDAFLTHKIWGTLIFFALMFLVFSSVFFIADPSKAVLQRGSGWLGQSVESCLPDGPLRSLLIDGFIAGVGGVVVFIPQILVLFFFISILEDCGYMARAAFLMDKLMSRCGLSGKSFIPLLSSVACAVPGIMATRVIENRWDRLATIVVAPLMSCSARLPVYTLMISLFLPEETYSIFARAAVLFGLYMIGFIAAPLVALLLRKTLLRGGVSRLLMEMPNYKRPSLKTVAIRVLDAGWAFLKRAGTIILATMILVWAALYFPSTDAEGRSYETLISETPEKGESLKLKAEWKRRSYLGQTGLFLEPVFAPLGWDWRIGMAALSSFPAREVIIGTLSILYEVDAEDEDAVDQLRGNMRSDWDADPIRGKYAVPVALSVLVFFALCCQCASTLAVIRRETKTWRWPIFTFVYMTLLAYVSAFFVFQVGRIAVG